MRTFRLPTKSVLKQMGTAELKRLAEAYEDWYLANEEDMTFAQSDRALAQLENLKAMTAENLHNNI